MILLQAVNPDLMNIISGQKSSFGVAQNDIGFVFDKMAGHRPQVETQAIAESTPKEKQKKNPFLLSVVPGM